MHACNSGVGKTLRSGSLWLIDKPALVTWRGLDQLKTFFQKKKSGWYLRKDTHVIYGFHMHTHTTHAQKKENANDILLYWTALSFLKILVKTGMWSSALLFIWHLLKISDITVQKIYCMWIIIIYSTAYNCWKLA